MPGWDFVGTLLDPTPDLPAGCMMTGFVPWLGSEVGRGSYAEVITVAPEWVAPLPSDVDPLHAVVFAMNGLTGGQAADRMGPLQGANVVVVGAGGPVGMSAAAVAVASGARVYVTGSERDESLAGQGYAGVMPRGTSEEMAAAARAAVPGGMDAVFNAAVAGPGLIDAVKDGGTFVSIHVFDENKAQRGVKVEEVVVEADSQRLTSLLTNPLIDRIRIETMPLDQARLAHERLEHGGLEDARSYWSCRPPEDVRERQARLGRSALLRRTGEQAPLEIPEGPGVSRRALHVHRPVQSIS